MNHDVVRNGRFVRVTIGAASREKQYPSEAAADDAYLVLMFSKEAREKFLRANKKGGR